MAPSPRSANGRPNNSVPRFERPHKAPERSAQSRHCHLISRLTKPSREVSAVAAIASPTAVLDRTQLKRRNDEPLPGSKPNETNRPALPVALGDPEGRDGSQGNAQVDLTVMHSRRSAWANQSLSSTLPIFQQGQLVQAVGTEDGGFAQSLGGIPIIADADVTTTASSTQDKVYLVAREDAGR